jgi:hypothetical protein
MTDKTDITQAQDTPRPALTYARLVELFGAQDTAAAASNDTTEAKDQDGEQ